MWRSLSFKNLLKVAFILLILRPFVWFFLGINRYSRLKLPEFTEEGPLIIAANHNSHLDTVLIGGLLPLSAALRTSFVAAGDYFYEIPFLSWLLFDLFEMIPVWRDRRAGAQNEDKLSPIARALQGGRIVVIFPEGTRGKPENRSDLKKGVAKLALRCRGTKIVPLYMRGLGKSLPRGEMIFIPLIPQVASGEAILCDGKSEEQIMAELAAAFESLEGRVSKADWVPV